MNRKDQIIEIIKKSDKPISASTLAKNLMYLDRLL